MTPLRALAVASCASAAPRAPSLILPASLLAVEALCTWAGWRAWEAGAWGAECAAWALPASLGAACAVASCAPRQDMPAAPAASHVASLAFAMCVAGAAGSDGQTVQALALLATCAVGLVVVGRRMREDVGDAGRVALALWLAGNVAGAALLLAVGVADGYAAGVAAWANAMTHLSIAAVGLWTLTQR